MQKVAPPPSADSPPSDPPLDKVRVPLIQRAMLRRAASVEDVFVIDIGAKGVFVERQEPMEQGEELEIRFLLPGNDIPIRALCRVAWWHPPSARVVSKRLPAGLGLQFVDISAQDLDRVRRHVAQYLSREPRHRRFFRHPEDQE